MSPTRHAIISAGGSLGIVYITHSWTAAVFCFLSGVLIDIDHVFDYWAAKRRVFFSYEELVMFCGKEKEGRLYLIFHSYELLAAGWILYLFTQPSVVWLGFLIGVTVHLLCDQYYNDFRSFSYFLTYR